MKVPSKEFRIRNYIKHETRSFAELEYSVVCLPLLNSIEMLKKYILRMFLYTFKSINIFDTPFRIEKEI